MLIHRDSKFAEQPDAVAAWEQMRCERNASIYAQAEQNPYKAMDYWTYSAEAVKLLQAELPLNDLRRHVGYHAAFGSSCSQGDISDDLPGGIFKIVLERMTAGKGPYLFPSEVAGLKTKAKLPPLPSDAPVLLPEGWKPSPQYIMLTS
jgi:hypothetical protein